MSIMADFLHGRGCAQANFSQFLRRENAEQHPSGYFDWMRCGADLYKALKLSHPLLPSLHSAGQRCCLETFPHSLP